MATSTDLDNEKRRKMQNMLLSKAKKRRLINEIETNQQVFLNFKNFYKSFSVLLNFFKRR